MLEWIIYREGYPRHKYIAAGTARSSAEAEDQARQNIIWELGEGLVKPSERIEVVIESNVKYIGTVEGFMGKTALKKMGLA